MKKWRTFSLAAILFVGLTANMEVVFADEIETVSIEETLFDQGRNIEIIHKEISDMQAEITELNNNISMKEIDKQELENKIAEKEKEVLVVQKELEGKIKTYEENMGIAKKRMISLQEKNEPFVMQFIDALLQSESVTEMFERAYNMSLLLNSHTEFMEKLELERIEIENQKTKLMDEKKTIESDKAKVEQILLSLSTSKKEATDKMKNLEDQKKILTEAYEASMAIYQNGHQSYAKSIEQVLIEKEENQKKVQAIAAEALQALKSTGNSASLGMLSQDNSEKQNKRTETIKNILDIAAGYIGVPYVWGGASPSGFDCSGLVQYVYAKVGIQMPRVANQQERVGESIDFEDLEPGDLLFWGERNNAYHVAIYIGGGKYIHAPQPGSNVQILSLSDFMPSYATRVIKKEKVKEISVSKPEIDITELKSETLGEFEVTYYSSENGRTRMGTSMANNNIQTKEGYRIVAVDPSVIPLGTILKVTTNRGETFLGQADDTGGAINGRIIDIAVKSHSEAIQLGRGNASIEIIK